MIFLLWSRMAAVSSARRLVRNPAAYSTSKLSFPFQNGDGDIGARARVRMDRAPLRILDLKLVVAEMFFDRPLQLPDGEHTLHQSRRADRMSAGDQSARGIHRADRLIFQLQAVVNVRQKGLARFGETDRPRRNDTGPNLRRSGFQTRCTRRAVRRSPVHSTGL